MPPAASPSILFIGGTKRGYRVLRALIEAGHRVVQVLSLRQDAHEVERYEEPIRALAADHGIPLFETKYFGETEVAAYLATPSAAADIAFGVGCRVLLPASIYARPRLGSLAVHDSLLPEYRGFAPLNWAIMNGETETGVTMFFVDETLDGGDITASRSVPIGRDATAPEVYELLCDATEQVVLEACAMLQSGATLPRTAQDYAAGSFTCSRTPDDGWIDWARPALEIHDMIRGLTYPYPGAFTSFEGKRLTIWRAQYHPAFRRYSGRVPGRVVALSRQDGWVDVLTGDSAVRLHEVERAGGQRTRAVDVLGSVRATLGMSPAQMARRVEELEAEVARLSAGRE